MISVCMITYNQENFIKQAIESVLNQETSYEFELNIFNDASTDQTDSIIRQLKLEHPRGCLVNYYQHDENIGLSANYIFSIKNCKGKYVAICEGDDYWIDSNKLQKQVDFLEKNPSYYLCFHQGLQLNTTENTSNVYPRLVANSFNVKTFFDIVTIPMASVVFRNNNNIHFLPGHSQMDFMMLCSLLMQGPAFFIKEVMSVYRLHGENATFSHFTPVYLKNRVNELGIESRLSEFNSTLRKEIGHLYIKHVLLALAYFRKHITRPEIIKYLMQSVSIKKRSRSYFQEYAKIFGALFSSKPAKPTK